MEVGMTIDILRAGLRIEEVEIDLQHRATGRDLAGQVHRAKQLRDVTRALAARGDSNTDTARGLVQSGIEDIREAGGLPGLIKRLKR
jgi:glucosyl-3-phosphoglycerate synthase